MRTFASRLSQALNSIKHTPDSFADFCNIDSNLVHDVLLNSQEPSVALIEAIRSSGLISLDQLWPSDGSIANEIVSDFGTIFRFSASREETARVFSRSGMPYYRYTDLASTHSSPIIPEHITPLVNDCAFNGEVLPNECFNKGHLEHQITFFVGDITFHWIEDGKKLSREMECGSSNYIMPYVPHSFTSRKDNSYIVAVTYKTISTAQNIEGILHIAEHSDKEKENAASTRTENPVKFFTPSEVLTGYRLTRTPRSPSVRLHTESFKIKTREKQHCWLYIVKGSAKSVSDSTESTQLNAGDSMLTSEDTNLLVISQGTCILEVLLSSCSEPSLDEVTQEVLELMSYHGIQIRDRMLHDNASWF